MLKVGVKNQKYGSKVLQQTYPTKYFTTIMMEYKKVHLWQWMMTFQQIDIKDRKGYVIIQHQ